MHELAQALERNPIMIVVIAVVSVVILGGLAVWQIMETGAITILSAFFILLAIIIIIFAVRVFLARR